MREGREGGGRGTEGTGTAQENTHGEGGEGGGREGERAGEDRDGTEGEHTR